MVDCVKKGICDLFRNKLRSFLTIGGICIGVLSVVVISSIGEIGKTTIDGELNNMGMNSVVITADKSNYSGLCEKDIASLKTVPAVDNAMPLMNFLTESTILKKTEPCMLWGVNEDADRVIELVPIYGRLLNKGDVISGAKVCVIDEKVAQESYKRSNIVGKKISVKVGGTLEDFTVVGVVENGVNILQSMLGEYIPSFVYIPYTTLQTESSQFYFDQIAVKIKGDESTDDLSNRIEQAILKNRDIVTQVKVDNLLKQKSQLNNIMSIITVVLSAIAGISLIVSGLSIMTVMLVSVNERTREIGIKKSIGATNADILIEFLLEALLITFIGAILGSLIGVAGSAIGCIIFGLKLTINFKMVFGIVGFSMIIGLVFGVYPAFRAATLKPVDALRYE